MFHEFILAFLSGALVKIVDELDDRKNKVVYLFALVYGAAIGYIISSSSFSMLFLGALLAQLIAKKIDKPSHTVGFLFAICSMVYLGLPRFEFLNLGIFLVLAFLDEQVFRKPLAALNSLSHYRAFLKIGALFFALFGRVDYLIAILLFDGAYLIIDRASK